ncbi:unnamed protein product [Schistosoma mattheei]|uniref:Uncharacterized protein n=1 Tax=Schistosoma mattheei TaxID=31246 RepID=A0A183PQV1_9TREM|nr:unnamed protein product [Schistosoma mattheei]
MSSPFVFLLRCPYCDLTTIRWIYFLMHPASCTGIRAYFRNRRQESEKVLPLVYRCHIYWCSKCQVVSTEQKLIAEHVTYSHNPKVGYFALSVTIYFPICCFKNNNFLHSY